MLNNVKEHNTIEMEGIAKQEIFAMELYPHTVMLLPETSSVW